MRKSLSIKRILFRELGAPGTVLGMIVRILGLGASICGIGSLCY